jgi:hypothetical protein
MPPPLLKLADEAAYRQHFHANYCTGAIMTHDGIPVYFDRWKFDHAFFESVAAKDDTFSLIRAERMDWIRLTLQDVGADRFQGWNKKTKTYEPHRRVEVVHEDFVVVLQISRKRNGHLKAKFVTCYQADNSIGMIRQSPVWDRGACENALP